MKIKEFLQASMTEYGYIAIHDPAKSNIYHFDYVIEIPDYLMNKKIFRFNVGFHYDEASGAEFVLCIVI